MNLQHTVANVAKAFSADTDPIEFLRKYGEDKPAKDHQIIFTCLSGKRAQVAAETLVAAGFTK